MMGYFLVHTLVQTHIIQSFFSYHLLVSEILQISATSILGADRPAFWGTKKEDKKNTQTEIILVMQFIGVNLL